MTAMSICCHVLMVKFDQCLKGHKSNTCSNRKFRRQRPLGRVRMKQRQTDRWLTPLAASHLRTRATCMILWLLVPAILWLPANAQQAGAAAVTDPAPLTAEQIVHNLARMNLYRAQALHAYQETRTYQVKYNGFLGARSAKMVVIMNYLSPGKKKFVVQSETGSKLIIDRVFKKLLEAEKEESSPSMEQRFALTNANYRFTLIGEENGFSGAAYVLEVEPRRKDKFLYHGRIWVDAGDFAVVRLEAEPAKNPSFWTKKAGIVEVYTKVNDFWLPSYNHSVTAIRLGGHAELTIDYKDFEITNASQVSGLVTPQLTLQAATGHASE